MSQDLLETIKGGMATGHTKRNPKTGHDHTHP